MARRIYLQLTYDEYKDLERQLNDWANMETTHTGVPGPFYHKSISFTIGEIQFEFHGPAVAGEEAKIEVQAKPQPAVSTRDLCAECSAGPMKSCVDLACGHRVCRYCFKFGAHKCEEGRR